MRHVHQQRLDVVQVGLREADAHGQDEVGVGAAHGRPVGGQRATRLMADVGRKTGREAPD